MPVDSPTHTTSGDQPATPSGVTPASPPGFELLDEIGRGGMGVVYRARDTALDRDVAVKLLSERFPLDSLPAQRFLNEARITGQLQHPGIPAVHQIGNLPDGRPFLAMKLIQGSTLEAILHQRPDRSTERGRLLAIFEAVCQAVGYAHAHRVIHRDLKPANVMVGAFGEVQVMDWGLAKVLRVESRWPDAVPADGGATQAWMEVSPAPLAGSHTQAGNLVGTPAFMPPEQAVGEVERVNERSDVFGLGALLAVILTGQPPYVGETFESVRVQAVRGKLEGCFARLDASGAEPELVALCKQCLAFEPADRPANGGEVAQAVAAFRTAADERARRAELERVRLEGEQATAAAHSAAQARVSRLFKRFAGGLAVALCLALALAMWAFLLQHEAKRQEQAAQHGADKARKARDFLVSIFRIEDVKAGNTTTARQILNQAEQRIPIEFAEQPELRDELLAAIADVNRSMDRTIPAAMLLEARGSIQLHSPRGDGRRPVPQTLLYPDDRLTLAADAQVQLVLLSDLHKERLRPGAEATVGRKGCSPAAAVRERDDSVLMTFVRLPKGTFYMGWNGTPGSAKMTEIREDFEIAVHDVTQGQWEAIMGSNPSWFSRTGNGRNAVLDVSDEELKLFPVDSVSWEDAQAFLKKLNEKDRSSGYAYRLPTEAEWEYACRGGASSLEECSYHFYFDTPTNDLSSRQANFNGNRPFGKGEKGPWLRRPTRVGAYPPNKLGLCDMHGNVWQWTDTAQGPHRVLRGGSFYSDGPYCRAGPRFDNRTDTRSYDTGLRLARVPVR